MSFERLAKVINNANYEDLEVLYGEGTVDIIRAIREEPVEEESDLESIPFHEDIIEWAEEILRAREERIRAHKSHVLNKRLVNKARYLFEPVLKRYETSKTYRRWHYEPELRSGGLLPLALMHNHGQPNHPLSIQVLNCLPADEDNPKHQPINSSEWTNLMSQGLYVSGERIAWSKVCIPWIAKMFPKAIDARGYNHSLNAPTYCTLHECKIELRTIKTMFELDAGTDGSGRIHPDHELFQLLHRPGGACTVQVRGINEKGLFLKGILVPDERCVNSDGEPSIWFDWAQIKGAHKDSGKKLAAADAIHYTSIHLGVIRVWDRPSSFNWCFEVLENLKVNPDTIKLVKGFVDESMENLFEGGVDAILRQIAKDDPKMALLVKFINVINGMGADFNPMQIPTVAKAVEEKLGKILWKIATGSGKKSKQVVVCIDAAVAPGTVVVRGYKPGTALACFRYPIVLEQGLHTYTVAPPLPHHLIKGRILRETIFMNPIDIIDRHQGDDDGDTFAITNDPMVIELFKHVACNEVYLIEPSGEKFDIDTLSKEGLEYLNSNPMGPIGLFTMQRANLLAVGDQNGARAMSILIQEAVDSNKKKVRYSDWRKAANLCNWVHNEETDRWSFNRKLKKKHYVEGDIDLKMVSKWVNARLADHGVVFSEDNAQHPLGWKLGAGGVGKRIVPSKWTSTYNASNNLDRGNLVHIAFDHALECWRSREDEFSGTNKKTVSLQALLPGLLTACGHPVAIQGTDWESYQRGLRERSGLRAFGQEMQKLMSANFQSDQEDDPGTNYYYRKMEQIHQDLYSTIVENGLTLQDLVDIWVMETSPEGNVNNAFRAVSWAGSPVLSAVGIEWEDGCTFLTVKKTKKITKWALDQADPFKALADMIFNSSKHAEKIKDEAGDGIHGWQCKHCQEQLTTSLIRSIRNDRKRDQRVHMNTVTHNLNGHE